MIVPSMSRDEFEMRVVVFWLARLGDEVVAAINESARG